MPHHEEFLELCAVSITGELTEEEQARLDDHLRSCSSCRQTLKQYRETAGIVLPELAGTTPIDLDSPDASWPEERARTELFKRIREIQLTPPTSNSGEIGPDVPGPLRWREFGLLYAAGILLFLGLAVCAYRFGEKRGAQSSDRVAAHPVEVLETAATLSDAGHDRNALLAAIADRDRSISALKQQIAKSAGSNNQRSGLGPSPEEARESAAGEKAKTPSSEIAELQAQLEIQERQRAEELAKAKALELNISELTKQLQDKQDEITRQNAAVRDRDNLLEQRDTAITRQQELLAHDRDIRDLMSARDLYIAEVYDVNKTGETNKPYGRIFYTRGKSLLFYAYDLDQQAGLKKASTFQAWGRREGGQDQPVSLGVLYEDSVANKRWVVRSEDPKTLDQIDAVFVTIEPTGGSRRPSGKPLLFASLRIHPNHP
jgi:hypothetical protein